MNDDIDIPASAQRLERKARAAGWTVSTSAARGRWNGRDIDGVAVRLSRGDSCVVALWEDGKFRTALSRSPFGRLSSRDLNALVDSEVAS
jgi:hypothetical protein